MWQQIDKLTDDVVPHQVIASREPARELPAMMNKWPRLVCGVLGSRFVAVT